MSLAFDEYGRPFIILRVGLVLPDQTAYFEVVDHSLYVAIGAREETEDPGDRCSES